MSDRSRDTAEGEEPPVSEERIAELEERIEGLSQELRTPPEGPFGLPRPPTPDELLAFADDHAIPTTIAVLETSVRTLKALRAAIRLLRRTEEYDPGERPGTLRDRTDSVAREAVAELDRAVSDLTTAIEGEALPDDEQARSVLQEIRSVRDDVADALETGSSNGSGTTDDAGGSTDGRSDDGDDSESSGESGVEIDVENELASIKDDMRRDGSSGRTPAGSSEDGGDSENGGTAGEES